MQYVTVKYMNLSRLGNATIKHLKSEFNKTKHHKP